jgi:ComF family protein
MKGKLEFLYRCILDHVFPCSCVSCGRWGALVCETCLDSLHPLWWQGTVQGLSVTTLFHYEGLFRLLMRRYKLDLFKGVGPYLSRLMLQHYPHSPFDSSWVWVRVPSHPNRIQHRGFDPVLELFNPLQRHWKMSWHPGLSRRVDTPHLYGMDVGQRRSILKGAFKVDSEAFVGKSVVVVDDIVTSGSTLNELSHQLYQAGAAQVVGLGISHRFKFPYCDNSSPSECEKESAIVLKK